MAPKAVLRDDAWGMGSQLWLLHYVGLMRHPQAGAWSSLAFHLRRAAGALSVVCLLICQAINMLQRGTADLDRFTTSISTFNTVFIWLFRLVHSALHEAHYHHLALQVNRDFEQFMDHRDAELLYDRSHILRRFASVYPWAGVAGCTWWFIFPLIRFGVSAEGLPFFVSLPYDVTRLFAFIPTYLFTSFLTLYTTATIMAVDAFNVSCITQLRLQLVVLSTNLKQLRSSLDWARRLLFDEGLPKAEHPSGPINYEDISFQIRRRILHHQTIIRNVGMLEKCLSGVLLLQSLSTGGAFCIQLYQIAVSSQNMVETVKYVGYLCNVSMELYVYCFFGNDLITESENISLSAYSLLPHLVGCPTSIKRMVILLQTRAQRPLHITAGGLFVISRESFVAVVNMSYSYYTILRNFKEN